MKKMLVHKQNPTDPVDVYEWEIILKDEEQISIYWQRQFDRYQRDSLDKRSVSVQLKGWEHIVLRNADDAKFCYEMLQEFFKLLKAAMEGRAQTEVRISVTQEEIQKDTIN